MPDIFAMLMLIYGDIKEEETVYFVAKLQLSMSVQK